jgi:LEA14-like dessication related protein
MRKLFFYFLIPCFVFFVNCKDFKEVQCTGVSGFKVNTLNTTGIDADLLLSIKNPNPIGFSLYKSEFDVMYGGVSLGKAKLGKRVHIDANAESVYSFNLKSDFKNANLMDIMKLVSGVAGKSMLEVKGDLRAGKFYLKKKFPINVTQKIGLN